MSESVTLALPGLPGPVTVPGLADARAAETEFATLYGPYLAATPLPRDGVAIDVGAGFGGFALPLARACPGWVIWAFEPDLAGFAALEANIASLGLSNIIAVNGAVLAEGEGETLAPDTPPKGDVPAAALATLGAGLVKCTDAALLPALATDTVAHMLGTLDTALPSQTLIAPDRQLCLPLKDSPFALRQGADLAGHRPGLDVVIAAYNARDYIEECVRSIIDGSDGEIRALMVDDGSKDGTGDLVEELFGDDPRVVVLRKPNGGCASARNFGRLHSDAAHITFVDADDFVTDGFFPKLLELARWTGAEVVQGGFEMLMPGGLREPSYEIDAFAGHPREPLGEAQIFRVPARDLMRGQPTIWRRVYRRDFLDHRDVWFPEHIRAFDDQIFQLLTLYYARDIWCRDDCAYLYRQHEGQDIRAGDERFFYSLEMFRLMLKRGLTEGWNDFEPLVASYINTVNWIHKGLRADLQPRFLLAAAELWVLMEKSLGDLLPKVPEGFAPHDFAYHASVYRARLGDLSPGLAFAYLDGAELHAALVKSRA